MKEEFKSQTPINYGIVKEAIESLGLPSVGNATIREIVRLVNIIEQKTGQKYIRMEMGVPGLDPAAVGIEAEIDALRKGVASKYPMIEGVEHLKHEISRFVKNFIDIDVSPASCVPSVGSMQGAYATYMVAGRSNASKNKVLFIDPGFPVHKQQLRVMGMDFESFDVYNYRGEKLADKLESMLSKGDISMLLYSNPNNPSWICFTEKELQIIAEKANKYDVIVVEDLAYFAMDFRQDLGKPGVPPYQPSVAKYTDNYVLLISSSKAFSYAGQRVGMIVVSDKLYSRKYADLKRFFSSDEFGYALIYGALYALSSGCSHSAQYALAAMLKAANDGEFNFVEDVKEYGERAKIMKDLFTKYGFKIVYDKDIDKPIADGFYFTFSYPGMSGAELLEELIYYGISAISLSITGSERTEGLRACVSQTGKDRFPDLEERLKIFHEHHK
ncbi:MAG: pyridoxal phosphate-dependent aminotransferase [Marinilabiliales bacterium]